MGLFGEFTPCERFQRPPAMRQDFAVNLLLTRGIPSTGSFRTGSAPSSDGERPYLAQADSAIKEQSAFR